MADNFFARLGQAVKLVWSGQSAKASVNAPTAIAETWNILVELLTLNADRKSKHQDFERLYKTDGYIHAALKLRRDRASAMVDPTASLFTVQCDKPEVVKATEYNLRRMGIVDRQLTRRIILNQERYGNDFFQLIFKPDYSLDYMHWLPDEQNVRTNIDEYGRLKNGDAREKKTGICAYEIVDDNEQFMQGFHQLEVAHFRSCDIDKFYMGESTLESIRYIANVLRFQKNLMLIARQTRAYGKNVHYVPTTYFGKTQEQRESDIQLYIDSMRKRRSFDYDDDPGNHYFVQRHTPPDVTTDLFLPWFTDLDPNKQGKVEFHEFSNAQLQNIQDVEFIQNEAFAVLGVPKSYLANERDVTAKATLTNQDIEFQCKIAGIQADYLNQVQQVNRLLLFFAGLWSFTDRDPLLTIYVPSPFVLNEAQRAEIEESEARAVNLWIQSGVLSRRTARNKWHSMDDKANDDEAARIATEQTAFPSTAPGLFGMSLQHTPADEQLLEAAHELKRKLKDIGNGNFERTLALQR